MWPWLVSIGSWVVRLVGGWLPIGTKPVSEWLGKIVWVVGIIFLCLIVWNKFTRPTSNTTIKPNQTGEQICNSYHQEQLSPGILGCASLKVYEYYKDKKNAAVK